ncbi:MAG: pyridoxamine 5'-phosphate oxidase family protein [Rhodoferax sp.]|nr:pyridoxamine 5'-phosphate oxidase family protein [Rhodoferax sp.]
MHRALHHLLHHTRVAALGTLDADGAPMVSMVPFAIAPTIPALVLHVSALAAHTGNMTRHPAVSLLVMQPERAGKPVHALPRVTLHGRAETVTREDTRHATVRQAYLDRFPDTEPMMQLGDFRLLLVQVSQARQVAGFGAARSVEADELRLILATATLPG